MTINTSLCNRRPPRNFLPPWQSISIYYSSPPPSCGAMQHHLIFVIRQNFLTSELTRIQRHHALPLTQHDTTRHTWRFTPLSISTPYCIQRSTPLLTIGILFFSSKAALDTIFFFELFSLGNIEQGAVVTLPLYKSCCCTRYLSVSRHIMSSSRLSSSGGSGKITISHHRIWTCATSLYYNLRIIFAIPQKSHTSKSRAIILIATYISTYCAGSVCCRVECCCRGVGVV